MPPVHLEARSDAMGIPKPVRLLVAVVATSILATACAGTAWKRALEQDTAVGYHRFLREHPGSKYVPEAQERIVIFSTHIVEDISGSCNRLAVLAAGRLLYQGTPQEMRHTAEGMVWESVVPEDDLPALEAQARLIGSLRTPEGVRARFLAPEPPAGLSAQPSAPTLEDAYLHMLGGRRPAPAETALC